MPQIIIYLFIGFVYSAFMARWFQQESENEILINFLLWALLIPTSFIVMGWRLIAGYTPSYYKKWYYIFSLW